MPKFTKGQSGNPAGRPKGIKDRRSALREKLLPHADQLIDMVVAYAKAGDPTAMRIVFERMLPPLKEEPVFMELPAIDGVQDCATAQAAVLAAVAAGELLPSIARILTDLIDAQRRAFEIGELPRNYVSFTPRSTT